METSDNPYEFVNGHFEWNSSGNELLFISHEEKVEAAAIIKKPEAESLKDKYEIEFKDDIELIDKVKFKRKYRRKVFLNDPTVILLQDVKDVTIFTANPINLTEEFISFLHTPMVDKFFRSLIIYFQFYFQTWEHLKERREEMEVKITQPVATVLENHIRDDLSDLRCMFAREYFSLVIGSEDAGEFHHAQSAMSLSERDRRLSEMLIQFSTRLVWYALNKPSLAIIDQEINRLARTHYFNKYEHSHSLQSRAVTEYNSNEKRILRGTSDSEQTRLKTMTPVGKEIMKGVHDHRMLAIGQVDFPPSDDRLRFLEKLYLLPEEEFEANNICIGILGMPRDNFDVMLKQKRKKAHGEEETMKDLVFSFEIPSCIEYRFDAVSWTYPMTPPRIELNERKLLLNDQRKIWINRLRTSQYERMDTSLLMESCSSFLLP